MKNPSLLLAAALAAVPPSVRAQNDVAAAAANGAGQGAMYGAVVGPLGAGIGAAIGAATGAIGAMGKGGETGGLICGVHYYGPCLPEEGQAPTPQPTPAPQKTGKAPATAEAPKPVPAGAAFAPSAFDALAGASQDELSRQAMSLNPSFGQTSYQPGPAILAAGLYDNDAPAVLAQARFAEFGVEGLEPQGVHDHAAHDPSSHDHGTPRLASLPATPPGGDRAPGVSPIGAPLLVQAEAGDGAFHSTGNSPNALTQLVVLARRMPRPIEMNGSAEDVSHHANHAWGLDINNHAAGFKAKRGSEFFGIRLTRP